MGFDFRWLGVVAVAAGLCSCSTVRFYTQAIQGQTEILSQARPFSEVLADPQTPQKLRDRLRLVQDIRDFAEKELRLPARGQYDRYADLGRQHVSWVVFAAPEFDVEAHEWWYPVVGRLKYRGFFSEAEARKEAARLRARGMDVFVGGVDAYSTLGYFRDPVLNTFAGLPETELAELIFHELTHQRLYLHGDTDFNEAYATAHAMEGVRRWLRARGRLRELGEYEKETRVLREFITLLLQTREELRHVYPSLPKGWNVKVKIDAEDLRKKKSGILERLRQRALAMDRRHGGTVKTAKWFDKPVNNARLNTAATYYHLVPGFEALLRQCGGDLEKFHAAVAVLRMMDKEERAQHLLALASA